MGRCSGLGLGLDWRWRTGGNFLLQPGQPLRTEDNPEVLEPPAAEALLWLDLTAPTDTDLALLGERFRFHPLALEDCAHADQRPKCEEYGDYMFIVSQGFQCPNLQLDDMQWYELHVFLGKNYVVTVHDTAIPGVEQVWKRVAADTGRVGHAYGIGAHAVLDDCGD